MASLVELQGNGVAMEFSRALAHASFIGLMWLMIVTAILFAALTLAQYLRDEPNASPAITIGSAIGCLALAMLLRFLARKIVA